MRAMQASPFETPEPPRSRRTTIIRVVAWTAVLVALIAGLLMYLRYARGISPLL